MPCTCPASARRCTAAVSAIGRRSLISTETCPASTRPAGHLRMTDLADGLVYSRSGLTYQAAQLEKRGLVSRTPGADDERSVTVTLTPAGRAVLADVMPGHVEVVQRLMLDALTPADITTVAGILGKVRDHMRTAPPRSAAPRADARKRG